MYKESNNCHIFRSKNNPYWNTLVISGYNVSEDKPFLGQIDSQVNKFGLNMM